jgi:uncharacterized membrane protein YfhO
MAEATDFADTVWLDRSPHPGVAEAPLTLTVSPPAAPLRVREIGTDLFIEAEVRDRTLVATSVPDWPGWRAQVGDLPIPLTTVNHAFVGFWLPAGRHVVRLHYLPASFLLGSALAAAAFVGVSLAAVVRRRRAIP